MDSYLVRKGLMSNTMVIFPSRTVQGESSWGEGPRVKYAFYHHLLSKKRKNYCHGGGNGIFWVTLVLCLVVTQHRRERPLS